MLSACGGPVPVYWIDSRAEPDFATVEDACGYWGLDCFEADESKGALTVWVSEHGAFDESADESIGGRRFDKDPCGPMVWATDDALDLEHEIGHAFGLKHRDDSGNVMHADGGGTDATDWQHNRVHTRANFLADCVGG